MSDRKSDFDPVKEFVSLRDNISKVVGDGLRNVAGAVYPAVDVYETEDAVIVYTQPLKNADKNSFEVSMEAQTLTISGKTEPPTDVDDEAYLHRELRYGSFNRTVQIPRDVKANEAKAAFKDNVLTITLPKQEQPAGGQIIDVTSAE